MMDDRERLVRKAHQIMALDHEGLSLTGDAIDWAVMALEAGHAGSYVCMLAASPNTASWYETEPYFRGALREVGIAWLGRDAAQWKAAQYTAEAIANGSIDAQRGVRRLAWHAIELGCPEVLMELYVLEDELYIRYGPHAVDSEEWAIAARAAAQRFLDSI